MSSASGGSAKDEEAQKDAELASLRAEVAPLRAILAFKDSR